MENGNGPGSFSNHKSSKLASNSSASHVTNSALPQCMSSDELLVDGADLLKLEKKLYEYRDEEIDVSANERHSSRVASLKQNPQYEPISLDDQIRQSRQPLDDADWRDKVEDVGRNLPPDGSECLSKLSAAGVKSNSHIPNNIVKSQLNTRASYIRRDSEVLEGNSFSALSIPVSSASFQDPFNDRANPVQLRVRTDIVQRSRQHQSRDKAHSLPSSPTGKKVRNVGRRGTVQSAVEPRTKRKAQPSPLPSARIYHEGESSLIQMNRPASISLVPGGSSIATKEGLPLPPFSIPAYLELELSTQGPPAQYRLSSASNVPFEPSKVKLEKLLNFLIVPLKLELFIGFGTLACFDSWLYIFTILPLRFCKAVWILLFWLKKNAGKEIADMGISIFNVFTILWCQNPIVNGTWRESNIEKGKAKNAAKHHVAYTNCNTGDYRKPSDTRSSASSQRQAGLSGSIFKHRRTRSTPSVLVANHKADLLKGLLFIFSCVFLTHLDASRMYHNIRGQSTIKLYVIYNVLEVSQCSQPWD